jgi:hypothetical protein
MKSAVLTGSFLLNANMTGENSLFYQLKPGTLGQVGEIWLSQQ